MGGEEPTTSVYEYEINEDGTTITITKYTGTEAELSIPNKIDEYEVTKIGDSAFSGCSKLTGITIPNSIKEISGSAFSGCIRLININIPSSVTNIASTAFNNCNSLEKIEVEEGNSNYSSTEDGILFNKTKTELIKYPANKEGEGYTIPETVTTIKTSAFAGNDNLTSVHLPESITSIESYAFGQCSKLENIQIPENVTKIDVMTFKYCSSLKNMQIPENITSIEYEAFYGCSSLESVVIPNNVTKIEGPAFRQCSNLKIYCKNDSTAKQYAESNNIEYVIDEEGPTISIEGNSNEWTKENVILTINAQDNEAGCGLASKPYSFDGGATWQEEKTSEEYSAYGNVQIKVRDVLGNERTLEQEIKIDKTAPTAQVEGNLSENTKGNVTLTIRAQDNENGSGLANEAYSFDGGQNWESSPTKTYTENTEGIVIKVRDKLGNETPGETINIRNIMKLEGIQVSAPTKVSYVEGERLNTEGLVVTAIYDNGETETITEGYTCTPETLNTVGTQEITVEYEGKTATFNVGVEALSIAGIELTTVPTKTSYYEGDTIDTRGLVLTATYNNGATEEITEGYNCTPEVLNTAGKQAITVAYGGQTATFEVDVEALSVEGIEVKTAPRKTSYYEGDTIDTRGLVLTATYNNGTTEEITGGYECTPEVLNTAGKQAITVAYEGQTTTFEVDVEEVSIVGIEVKTRPDSISYYKGDELNTEGLVLTAIYNNGATEEITEGYECTPEVLSVSGSQAITVEYEGKTTTFNVIVLENLQINVREYEEEEIYITNISSETKISQVLANIETNGEIKVYKEGTEVENPDTNIGTGMVIEISLNEETVQYQAVVIGDCNGNGTTNVADLTTLMQSRAESLGTNRDESKILRGAYEKAVDLNEDGRISVSDITNLCRYIAENK